MKEPKLTYKIFCTKRGWKQWDCNIMAGQEYIREFSEPYFKEEETKPTLKGAVGWRSKKSKPENYIIIPCY